MNWHRRGASLFLGVGLIVVAEPVYGQAGRSTGSQVPPAQVPAITTDYVLPEERLNRRIQELQDAVGRLESEIHSLREQLNNVGPTRAPVPLTADSDYPTAHSAKRKTDDYQMLSESIKNLWEAIELLKKDIRKGALRKNVAGRAF